MRSGLSAPFRILLKGPCSIPTLRYLRFRYSTPTPTRTRASRSHFHLSAPSVLRALATSLRASSTPPLGGSAPVCASIAAAPTPAGEPAAEGALPSPDVPPFVMSEQATKAIKNAAIKAIRDSLRPVTIELTTKRTSMVAMKTSLDALCTTIDTQGVGSERAARALQQLEGTVKGGFSDVIEIVEPSATRSKNKGKDANARVGGQTPLSSAASGDGIGRGGGNVEEREHALMSKREEAERINDALCAIRDTLKELCTKSMSQSLLTEMAYPDEPDSKASFSDGRALCARRCGCEGVSEGSDPSTGSGRK